MRNMPRSPMACLPAGLAESGGGEGFTAEGRVNFAKARIGG